MVLAWLHTEQRLAVAGGGVVEVHTLVVVVGKVARELHLQVDSTAQVVAGRTVAEAGSIAVVAGRIAAGEAAAVHMLGEEEADKPVAHTADSADTGGTGAEVLAWPGDMLRVAVAALLGVKRAWPQDHHPAAASSCSSREHSKQWPRTPGSPSLQCSSRLVLHS